MCKFKSYIVTKDLKIHGSRKTSSHETIMAELEIKDVEDQDKILLREHVKIEVAPKDERKMTRNLKDWIYREDEENTLPEWYCMNKGRIEEAVFLQLTEDLKVQLAIDKEEREVVDTEIYTRDSSTVDAWGSSTVVARDSSTVVARDSSTVVAWDSSKVVAWDSSTVDAWDSSTVVARGSSTVEIKSECSVVLCNGKIFVNKKATMIVQDKVEAGKC
jgi:hypothetical protein